MIGIGDSVFGVRLRRLTLHHHLISSSPSPPSPLRPSSFPSRSIFRARWSLYLATRCFCLIPRRSLSDSLVANTALESARPPARHPRKRASGRREPSTARGGAWRRSRSYLLLRAVRTPKRGAAVTAWSPFSVVDAAAASAVEGLEREGTPNAFCAQFTQAPRPGKIGSVGGRARI